MAPIGAKRRKILGFPLSKVVKWLDLGRNQGKLGNKTLRMSIFLTILGNFFGDSGAVSFPNFRKV
jgi:hypothetical protein